MFVHTFPKLELFDESNDKYIYRNEFSVKLEHSLLAISKWESEIEKPFLRLQESDQLTEENLLFYILCMDLTGELTKEQVESLTQEETRMIERYMEKQCTATTFSSTKKEKPSKKIITSEEIYYYLTSLNIPFECETWNIYRLLTLIKICGIKNNPNKMKKGEIADHYAKLNQARRAAKGLK